MGQFTDTRDCIDCHIDVPGWKTRPDLAFFNKNTKRLCEMQSEQVELLRRTAAINGTSIAQAVGAYLSHLAGDSLIDAAFIGKRGGAMTQADRPGMSRTEFVTAAKAWVEAGAGCGAWKGEITRTLTDHMDAADPQSWLTPAPVGISRSDNGISIPVTVTTTRDLTLSE